MKCRSSVAARAAFTLIELLIVVAVIGILSSGAYVAVSNVREGSRVQKLEADVATINRAIELYRIHDGVLPSGTQTPQTILTKLKSVSGKKYPGFSGRAIDVRLKATLQTADQAAAGGERAFWDAASQQFVIATTGSNGIHEFELDESPDLSGVSNNDSRQPPIELAQNDDWVWNGGSWTPIGQNPEIRPGGAAAADITDPNAPTALQLNPPVFDPTNGSSFPLIHFDKEVTLSNPNPSGVSEIVVIQNGTESLYIGPFTVGPDEVVLAYARSIHPDEWTDSNNAQAAYSPIPFQLIAALSVPSNSMTYAQAGGAMTNAATQTPPNATITVTNVSEIPTQFLDNSYFDIRYTTDGTVPSSSSAVGPPFAGSLPAVEVPFSFATWGSASTLVIQAAAITKQPTYFSSSATQSQSIAISKIALGTPTIDPPAGQKASDLPVSVIVNEAAAYPQNYRVYYTIDGTDPGVTATGDHVGGTLYNSSTMINSGAGTNGSVTVNARVYGPAGSTHWFTPSPMASTTYSTITLADGALIGSAELNGTFVGSLIYASPPAGGTMNNITFNGNAVVKNGNLYVPGTPAIRRTNGTIWSTSTDSQFPMIQGWEFDSAGNKTVQTTPRVLNENGSVTPDNYSITFNSKAVLEGKVIRRHDAPAFPTIDPPPAPDSTNTLSLNSPTTTPISSSNWGNVTLNGDGVGDVRLLAGHYGDMISNQGNAFVLGDPDNPEVTQYYTFSSLTLNSGSDIKVVGKAIVTVGGTVQLNSGSVLGDPNHPEWLQLQIANGGDLNANSGSTMYGQLVTPEGQAKFSAGSVFEGSVTANLLTINSESVAFTLPPVIEN